MKRDKLNAELYKLKNIFNFVVAREQRKTWIRLSACLFLSLSVSVSQLSFVRK